MKPEYEVITGKSERSFSTKRIIRKNRPLLSQAWHYHREIEICYTPISHGKRFVGNNISNYEEEDLVLFGSNIPHGFTTETKCEHIVIQMDPDFLGKEFFNKPELRAVKSLFNRAKRGLEFQDQTKKKAIKIIHKIMSTSGFTQMILLLELLDLLAHSENVRAICSEEYTLDFDATKLNRIKIVYAYIIDNYRNDIKVKELATLINLTEAAFFKFIKKHTKKTFTQIINEFRINHSTKLLMTDDKTIAQICYESGYNNISFFNRKFKEIMHQTPLEFRNSYK